MNHIRKLLLAIRVIGFPILLYCPINPVIQASLETCIEALKVECAPLSHCFNPPPMNSAQLAPVAATAPETVERRAISKIPGEAWMEIFKWTMDGQPPFDISQTHEGPWLLGRVCSAWRDLVIGRSPLWANFKLDVPC
ncbi:hypothetical protein IW261DRAFT_1426357 [Armillaria novae-zelandiae]|uniref:F-box domain-containing protein n=1 Tax=Armillaria novae-zelandiae TaxID=153914 RepID=A0AA39NN35_9AGAR|nr:hypothetical protein IW261DRAFT_1426357 [Armillaria novae-zelandiae]